MQRVHVAPGNHETTVFANLEHDFAELGSVLPPTACARPAQPPSPKKMWA